MFKNLSTLFSAVLAFILVVSCSDDDTPNPFGEQNPNPLTLVKMKINGVEWIAENTIDPKPDEYPVEAEYYIWKNPLDNYPKYNLYIAGDKNTNDFPQPISLLQVLNSMNRWN